MSSDKLEIDATTELKAKILSDAQLSEWFFDLCIGQRPRVQVSEDAISLMKRYGIIVQTESGFELGETGKDFGRKLGLIQEEDHISLLKQLLEHLGGKAMGEEMEGPEGGQDRGEQE